MSSVYMYGLGCVAYIAVALDVLVVPCVVFKVHT